MSFDPTTTASHSEATSPTLTPQSPPKTSDASKVAAPVKLTLPPPPPVLRPPSPLNAISRQQPQQQPQSHLQKSPNEIPTPTPKWPPPSEGHISQSSRPSGPSPCPPPPPAPSGSSKTEKSGIPTCTSTRPGSPYIPITRDARHHYQDREGRVTPPLGSSAAPVARLRRVPSRTQLEHASPARLLSAEALRLFLSGNGTFDLELNESSKSRTASPGVGALNRTHGTNGNEDKNKEKVKLGVISPGLGLGLGPAPGSGSGPDSPRSVSGTYKKQAEERGLGRRPSWAGLASTVDLNASAGVLRDGPDPFALEDIGIIRRGITTIANAGAGTGTLKRKDIDSAPDVPGVGSAYVRPLPLLRKSLEAAGFKVTTDSSSMETLLNIRDFLQATYMTPQTVHDKIYHEDSYYHVWVATRLAMEEKPLLEHDLEEVVKLALQKFIVELGSALVDCLKPGLPLYTFVDPRRLMHTDGARIVREQAIALVEGLEKKGIARERVYISIPATENGLAASKRLKAENGIQTNLVFVSNLAQAIACVETAGAAAITMPLDNILSYHEELHATPYDYLNPHPGRQAIKATACYTMIHAHAHARPHPQSTSAPLEKKEKVQVIGSSLRSIVELEHCSALDMVVLDDGEVERILKWTRMRVNRPPGEGSVCWGVAREAFGRSETSASASQEVEAEAARTPTPTRAGQGSHETEEEVESIPYLHTLPIAEEKNLTSFVLDSGLKCWKDGVRLIENVLRREIEVYRGPLEDDTDVDTEVDTEVESEEESEEVDENATPASPRSPIPRRPATPTPTPNLHSRVESSSSEPPPNVLESPYWKDMDSFEPESEDSSSDEEIEMGG